MEQECLLIIIYIL
ncbi:uncharacterized protein FFNC_01165 [Fusarium fujikuroi]|nr:uncharacterized protein FFNC_01165 [Fusarium fujikuroi]